MIIFPISAIFLPQKVDSTVTQSVEVRVMYGTANAWRVTCIGYKIQFNLVKDKKFKVPGKAHTSIKKT